MIRISLLLHLTTIAVQCCTGKDVNILSLAWLSFGDGLLRNYDTFSSFMLVPIAVKHFNDRYAGIVPAISQAATCNVTLRLINGRLHDDMGVSTVALSELIKMYSEPSNPKIDVIHGTARGDVAHTLGTTAGALKIPMVSHLVGADALSNKREYPTFFRLVTTDSDYAEMLANLFQFYRYTSAVLVYANDGTGQNFRDKLVQHCQNRNIRLLTLQYDASLQGVDMYAEIKRALEAIKTERINVIFHLFGTLEALWGTANVMYDGSYIKGKLHISHLAGVSNALFAGADKQTAVHLREFLRGSIHIVRGYSLESQQWRNLQEQWPTFSVNDVNPFLPNQTTKNGESYQLPIDYFLQDLAVKPKYRSLATAYDSIIAIGLAACLPNSSTLQESLASVQFDGTSGRVEFDENYDRNPAGVLFALENIVVNDTPGALTSSMWTVEVGRMVDGAWTLYTEPERRAKYSDGTSLAPVVAVTPPLHVIDRLPKSALIFGWVESALVVTSGLFMLVYSLLHRKDQAFVDSHPILMALLAIGCIGMGLSIVPLTMESDAGCMLFHWTFAGGFTLIMSSLTAKSITVAALWHGANSHPFVRQDGTRTGLNRVICRTRTLLFLVMILTTCGLAAMISWQAVAPLTLALSTFRWDQYGYPLASSVVCVISSESGSSVFFILVCVMHSSILILTFASSFWVRNTIATYQEAKMTAVAGIAMFQVFFVGLPTAAAVWNRALPRFLVLSSVTFMMCVIVLVTMFVPKIYNWRYSAFNLFPATQVSSSVSRADVMSDPPLADSQARLPPTSVFNANRKLPGREDKPVSVLRNDSDKFAQRRWRSVTYLDGNGSEEEKHPSSVVPGEEIFAAGGVANTGLPGSNMLVFNSSGLAGLDINGMLMRQATPQNILYLGQSASATDATMTMSRGRRARTNYQRLSSPNADVLSSLVSSTTELLHSQMGVGAHRPFEDEQSTVIVMNGTKGTLVLQKRSNTC